jgi:hypothetical protein
VQKLEIRLPLTDEKGAVVAEFVLPATLDETSDGRSRVFFDGLSKIRRLMRGLGDRGFIFPSGSDGPRVERVKKNK